jgi:hypothetical protein
VVYSVRVAVLGNPLFRMVQRADATLLARVEAATSGELSEITEDELLFLRRFSRLGLLEMLMVLVELLVFGALWWVDTLPALSLGLFLKNIAMLGFSIVLAYVYMADGLFEALLCLPRWTGVVDRLSALISGAGALVILLSINGISPW